MLILWLYLIISVILCITSNCQKKIMNSFKQNLPNELFEQKLGKTWLNTKVVSGIINPFNFYHRIFIYKRLINATNQNGFFGKDNALNPLWGLCYQLQWQYSSGRLNSQQTANEILPDSPWGYGNFTLSIIPYLGAVLAGIVPDITIKASDKKSRFNYLHGENSEQRIVPEELQPCITDWAAYFKLVAKTSLNTDDEPLRLALWKAHKTSLDVVAAKLDHIKPVIYSPIEIDFLRGWCKMVDFLWAAAWPTNHIATMRNGIDVLPHRPLQKLDLGNDFIDFSKDARNNTRSVLELATLSPFRHNLGLSIWKRIMKTRKARDEAELLLEFLFDKNASFKQRVYVFKYLFS